MMFAFCDIISMVRKMCRMISLISTKKVSARPYFEALTEQALHGKYSPHRNGWGVAIYDDEHFLLKKSSNPIWESPAFDEKGKIIILHARKTTSRKLAVSFSHPFTFSLKGKDWAFAHNGAIKNFFENSCEIDTQFYAEILMKELKKNNVVEAMEKTIFFIKSQGYEYTSLNSFLTDGRHLYAFRILEEDNDDYHSIFYKRSSEFVVMSTEPFGNGWSKLNNGEYLFANEEGGRIVAKIGKVISNG